MDTQNTNFIEELAMEVPENEWEEYEDRDDDRIGTTPYCGKQLRVVY